MSHNIIINAHPGSSHNIIELPAFLFKSLNKIKSGVTWV